MDNEAEGDGGREGEQQPRTAFSLSILCSVPPVAAFAGEEERRLIERGGGRKAEGGRATFLTRKFESYDVAKQGRRRPCLGADYKHNKAQTGSLIWKLVQLGRK